ncbi:hypothetical protein O181_089457 [Austropuccinia psidii MF-1]|uniref:Uncharacterized protein n=1 Tax=Austropuccinia psidii MF-1 TaxID=1389203 RepID=A0A9Q3P6Q7_9BASI|nr:hypothetical protein [Austropuccinia psidii MF-1]
MSPVNLRDLDFQRNQPEDREGFSRARRPGRGHLGHSGGWQNNEVENINLAIYTPFQQEPQTGGLARHGSSSSAPPTPQRLFQWSLDNKRFNLESHWAGLGASFQKICLKEIDFKDIMVITKGWNPTRKRTADPDRAYADSFRLTRSRPNQLPNGFTPFRNQKISGQESPFFTLPGGFQEKTRKQGQKEDLLQPEEEIVRPHDSEAVGFGERSAQEPEVVLNNSRISSPINRNITPAWIEHHAVTPESNLNSDALWLQMSQYTEKTQKQFEELEASHERMKKLTASMDKIVKTLQQEHAQLSKASEEANKRLNLVFEEQHHSRRDRDCLDQDINKFFNVYHSIKPQPQGHVKDNPYHPDEIKPDAMLVNKERSP